MNPIRTNETRLTGFEILRLISIVLILLMHTYGMVDRDSVNGSNAFIGTIINSVGNIGVTCFVLISGYFGVSFSRAKFVRLIYLTTLYALFVYIGRLTYSDNVSLYAALMTVPLYSNWFITCYLILMLLGDYINDFTERLPKAAFTKLVITLFVLFCVIPALFEITSDTVVADRGKSLVYFLFIYIVGRYIRLHADNKVKTGTSLFLFLLMTSIITVGDLLTISEGKHLSNDNSPFILISALSVFFLFSHCKYRVSWINFVAGSALSLYLLEGLRLPLSHYIFHIDTLGKSSSLIVAMLELIGLYIAIALIIDIPRRLFLVKYENKAINKLFAISRWGMGRGRKWLKELD